MNTKRARWPWFTGAAVIALCIAVYAVVAGVGSQIGRFGVFVASVAATPESAAEVLTAPHSPEQLPTVMAMSTEFPAAMEEPQDEHAPAEPATQPIIHDPVAYRHRLESLLESDPEALSQVRALLDEPDPVLLAENMHLLQDSFGIE